MRGQLYKLSITVGDKSFVCDNRDGHDIIIQEFNNWDEANNYINNNFIRIGPGNNYDYYYNTKEIKECE